MAARTDPARLHAELLAAGIPPAAFTGCRSGGQLETISWAPGHPTAGEQAAADAALAVHDPDGAKKDMAARLAAIRTGLAAAPTSAAWRAAVADAIQLLLPE